ncbi:MAG TPA: HlyD family efflux transporter periplasmic adaptor subunit [Pyrinomonadaceae bacterium]|nr:HlyD family efflux transporter periplasmic adaptor subunit [Pyrinomonadaceae bacterium]
MKSKISPIRTEKTEKETWHAGRQQGQTPGASGSSMDKPRSKNTARNKKLRTMGLAVVAVAAIAAITFAVSRMKPAAPGVVRSTVLIDTVKRGSMLRQVRGTGTLVPEDVRVIAASTEGRVERIHVQPGAEVGAGTVLIELVNPELQQSVVDIEYQIRAAEADLNNLRAQLDSQRMGQQAAAATVHAEYQQAKIQADTDATLAREGLIPELNVRLSRVRAEELANRYSIEQKRLEGRKRSDEAQIGAQQARVNQLKAQMELRRTQVGTLSVVAGTSGVLQQMQVEVGQQVTPGTVLARVVEPRNLKAELRIAETQAKDIALGQQASVDTRNGVIPGRVVRIDPAAEQGTVRVDVALEGDLPPGARPDLSVDGTIELERLENILYVGRPTFGQSNATVGMFKLEPGGQTAVRATVRLGRSSVNTIEVVEGLQEGDQVILSDTSQWDAFNRIELK